MWLFLKGKPLVRDENLVSSIPRDALNLDVEPALGLLINSIVDASRNEMTFLAVMGDVALYEIVLDKISEDPKPA